MQYLTGALFFMRTESAEGVAYPDSEPGSEAVFGMDVGHFPCSLMKR